MATKTATKATTKVVIAPAVELSPAGIRALKAFNRAKASEKRAKENKAKAEAILRAELGESLKATIDGIAVASVVGTRNTWFDRDLMLTDYAEAYEATLRETRSSYIKTAG